VVPGVVVTLGEILREMNKFRLLVEIEHQRSETAPATASTMHRRDRHHRPGIASLCGHCSRCASLRRQDPHLPFSVFDHDLAGRMRAGDSDSELIAYIDFRDRQEGSAPPHRRAGLEKPSRSMAYRRVAPPNGQRREAQTLVCASVFSNNSN